MKISKNWISEFLNIPKDINLENELTQLGLEVDTITKKKDDYIIDIEFTPNRGDCLSILGTTRDLAAYKKKKYNYHLAALIHWREKILFSEIYFQISVQSIDLCY